MKIGDFDITAWRYRGHQVAHPLTIARRVLALPIVFVGRVVLSFGALLGWGVEEAVDRWKDLA